MSATRGHIAHLRNSFKQKAYFRKAMIKLIKRDNKLISFLRIECSGELKSKSSKGIYAPGDGQHSGLYHAGWLK